MALFSTSAFAHLEKGTYEGRNPKGEICSFDVLGVVFEEDFHHPLNERFIVRFRDREWKVAHPFVFSSSEKRAAFDHDHLVAFHALKGGAEGIEILMDHSEGRDGPASFSYVKDDYKNDANDLVETCVDLVHRSE